MKYIILDVPEVESKAQHLLSDFDNVELISSKQLTAKIVMELEEVFQNMPGITLYVFPGNGSDIVKSYMPVQWFSSKNWIGIFAKRVWAPGEDPRTYTCRISNGMMLGISNVVVVDDVISSGQTIRKIRELNRPWIPGAVWHAATWVKQANACTKGYDQVIATIEVGEKNKRAPINSLSTLLSNKEIAFSYANRNFPNNPDDFLKVLENLR